MFVPVLAFTINLLWVEVCVDVGRFIPCVLFPVYVLTGNILLVPVLLLTGNLLCVIVCFAIVMQSIVCYCLC